MEIVEMIEKVIGWIPGGEWSGAFVVAGMIDFVLRMIPSEKPIGVMHLISGIVMASGKLLMKLAALMDKVLPQKLSAPK